MNEKELFKLISNLIDKNELTPENLNKLIGAVNKNPNVMSLPDMQAAMDELQNHIANSPQAKDLYAQMVRKRKADRISANVAPFLQAALAGGDIVTSLNQVKAAKKAQGQLRRPARPVPPPINPEIQTALDDARTRSHGLDTAALNALKLNNLDTYLGDLNVAKTASGGQAGLYGSLAQAAVNRRYRNNLQTLPLIEQSRQAARGQYGNLLAAQQQAAAQRFGQDASLYGTDMGQYNLESQAIGNLASTGRSNTRNSLYNAADILPGFIGSISTNPYLQSRLPRTPMSSPQAMGYRPDVNELGKDQSSYLQKLQDDYERSMMNQWGHYDRLS